MPTVVVLPLAIKKCTKCGQLLPLSEFWPDRRHPGKLRPWCIACSKRDDRARYNADPTKHARACVEWAKANPDKAREIRVRYEAKNGDRLRAEARAAYAEKRREKKAAYRKANAARIKASRDNYRERNREKLKLDARAYYAANRKAANARSLAAIAKKPEHYKSRNAAWKKANRDACNASYNRYRTKKIGNGGTLTKAEWAGIKAAQDHRCLMCRRQEPEIILTMDHVVPVSEGGRTDRANIQGLCRSCNSKKHRKVIDLRQPA